MKTTGVVKIERGRFSPDFQVIRAWLSAASALVTADPKRSIRFIDESIKELTNMRNALAVEVTR